MTTALFAAVPAPYVLLVAVSLLASNARGLSTLLAATAVSGRWGVARYARLNGMFNAPMMAASAIAPFIGAGLADVLGGYPAAFGVLAGIGALGAGPAPGVRAADDDVPGSLGLARVRPRAARLADTSGRSEQCGGFVAQMEPDHA